MSIEDSHHWMNQAQRSLGELRRDLRYTLRGAKSASKNAHIIKILEESTERLTIVIHNLDCAINNYVAPDKENKEGS